ncbi:MAG: protein-L-isoaspartate(D-aspartate) O-methyltransferase [Candidatus Aureabacteria bacterium]|nr:protein-L-isoaspartate(D-aspartate) O-methyltransferase [Candidatus Auribacterota bacterium]
MSVFLSALLLILLLPLAASHASPDEVFARQRELMLETQLRARDITDARVLRAMTDVPRHLFIPDSLSADAYEDRPLPIGYGQTISQPYIVALMTQLLHLPPQSAKVLEVGTGSGYQAAVLSRLAAEVYTIEIIPELAKSASARLKQMCYSNVFVREGDGYQGWKEHAPYDGIVVTAASTHVPPQLIEQLAEGGRMVIPVGSVFFAQYLMVVEKKNGKTTMQSVIPVRFVPLTGEHGKGWSP